MRCVYSQAPLLCARSFLNLILGKETHIAYPYFYLAGALDSTVQYYFYMHMLKLRFITWRVSAKKI